MKVKTSFVNGVSPFSAPVKPNTVKAKSEKPRRHFDFASLSMSNDPIPEHKTYAKKKQENIRPCLHECRLGNASNAQERM